VKPERVGQRQLAGLAVLTEDGSSYAKYVFPFFDFRWRVSFLALDLLGQPPKMWMLPARSAGRELRLGGSSKDLLPVASFDPSRFEGHLHFDPWWAFKGVGLPDPLVRVVARTNVAGRFHPLDVPRRVEDVAFDAEFTRLLAVDTEDEHFGRKAFVEGQLDLAKLLPR
jgi:hypothetical protein